MKMIPEMNIVELEAVAMTTEKELLKIVSDMGLTTYGETAEKLESCARMFRALQKRTNTLIPYVPTSRGKDE
jgi:hypothetical protein